MSQVSMDHENVEEFAICLVLLSRGQYVGFSLLLHQQRANESPPTSSTSNLSLATANIFNGTLRNAVTSGTVRMDVRQSTRSLGDKSGRKLGSCTRDPYAPYTH
jgi:hypothetical protein